MRLTSQLSDDVATSIKDRIRFILRSIEDGFSAVPEYATNELLIGIGKGHECIEVLFVEMDREIVKMKMICNGRWIEFVCTEASSWVYYKNTQTDVIKGELPFGIDGVSPRVFVNMARWVAIGRDG